MALSCFLLFLCFSASAQAVSAVSADGKALLSLVRQWKDVPSLIQLSWNDSDSYPCTWAGVKCDQKNRFVEALSLSGYGISGQLGPEIANLKQLKSVDLSMNSFSGSIPSELGNCSLLEYLDLSGNSFSGEMPKSLRNLKIVRHINFGSNSLNGTLPDFLFWISSLNTICLNNNELTGTVPSNIGNCSALQELHLNGNRLSGKIPAALGKCKSLVDLRMEQNQLEGDIPNELGMLSQLQNLFLQTNHLTGEIPFSIRNLTNVISVDLSMNKLSGAIPPEMGKLLDLQALNLSHNTLDGELPSQLSNCRSLLHLDVSHNLLNGSIPSSFRSLTQLSTLTLSENGLTGNIPNFLFEFRKLSKLQLGGNMLVGNIPPTVGSLGAVQNLMLLNLSSNMLTGEVPIQLRGLTMLEQIDISCNNLSGSLRFLHDIQSLVFINVSHNHFSGPIPLTLLRFQNSSPSSFAGNSGLFVDCLALNCFPNSNEKTQTYQRSKKKGHHKTKIALIVLGSSLPLVFLVVACTQMLRQGIRSQPLNDSYLYLLDSFFRRDVVCRYPDILKATDNLNDMYIIGNGGQGTIYKVTLSPDRVFVAKKHQFAAIYGGSRSMTREIQTIGNVRHRNLIRFLGSWSGKNYGLTLYAYMENGTLHDILHEQKPRIRLEWNTRYKIALSMAYGLSYLHFDCTPPILHRDIKPKNILLDHDYEPYISDFGLAVLLDSNASASAPMIVGTAGYLPPENAFKAKTLESDVYAYGVILLELITRKKAIDPSFKEQPDIVSWVRSMIYKRIDLACLIDPDLLCEMSHERLREEVHNVLVVALRCTHQDWNKRPSMREVVNQLTVIQRLRWTHYSVPEVGPSSNS